MGAARNHLSRAVSFLLMRHLLLALLIALLPIRSWMGDAMAVAMLAAPAHVMEQAASGTDHTMGADHAMGTEHVMTGDTTGMQDSGSEHTHKSCEVCNVPAMALAIPAAPTLAPQHGVLVPPAERFASSEPHRGTKPPIS
jgi:hypothetical protein